MKLVLNTSNSLICKALLKYNYNNFRLDIIEICDIKFLLEREQYYLDNFELDYNILKTAGSLYGYKHSIASIELMRRAKLGKSISEEVKLKLANNSQAFALKLENLDTEDILYFPSIRRTANYIGIHHSFLAKSLNKHGFYRAKNFLVTKE